MAKEKCANLFGGKEQALAKLNGANYSFRPINGAGGSPANNIGATTFGDSTVFINRYGPFVTGVFYDQSGTQQSVSKFLNANLIGTYFNSFILLHELGHLTGVFGEDAGDSQVNQQHSLDVINDCFR